MGHNIGITKIHHTNPIMYICHFINFFNVIISKSIYECYTHISCCMCAFVFTNWILPYFHIRMYLLLVWSQRARKTDAGNVEEKTDGRKTNKQMRSATKIVASSKPIHHHAILYIHFYPLFFLFILCFFFFCIAPSNFNGIFIGINLTIDAHTRTHAHPAPTSKLPHSLDCATMIHAAIHLFRTMKKLIY